MEKPLITIITVCYNAQECISQTIDSVLKQSWPSLEYIIVDGGSSDLTMQIVKSYEKDFVAKGFFFRYISEKDNGIYDAMNRGVAMARGTWVNLMNAGDGFVSSDVLEKLFSTSIPSDVKVVYGDVELLLKFGTVRMPPKPIDFLKKKMAFCHQAAFVRCDEIQSFPFDLSYRLAADYDFFYKCYNRGVIFHYIPIVVAYFESEDGVSSRNRLTVVREYARIHGVDSKLHWKLWYVWKGTRIKMKNVFHTILPASVLGKMREKNYKRLINRRNNNG